MGKDLYIGNTDHDWFEFCKSHPEFEQVNFWQPSNQIFRAMEEGGIFFFRRKAPINKIGGFGILASAHNASIGLLWDDLGQSNGLATEQDFIDRVKKYKKSEIVDRTTQVGFKIIIEQVFLDEKDWFDLPTDWSSTIVTGKGYSSSSAQGAYLLEMYQRYSDGSKASTQEAKAMLGFSDNIQARFQASGNKKIRVGQQAFRSMLISAYEGKCAVTGSDIYETLDAAHIVSFAENQNHSSSNGVLLRKDIHVLFDSGFIRIDRENTVRLTKKFRDSYPDSTEYDYLDGLSLRMPKNPAYRPNFSNPRARTDEVDE